MSTRVPSARAICLLLSGPDARARLAFAPDAWREGVKLATAEGVAPLLYARLRQAGALAELPSPALAALHGACVSALAHNSVLFQALSRLAQALAAVQPHPPVILLKGAALAVSLYPHLALRPMGDLDLLLPKRFIPAAIDALGHCGYARIYREVAPGLHDAVEFQSALRGGPAGRVTVELHWALIAGAADWRSPPLGWFWGQTEPWPGAASLGVPDRAHKYLLQLNPTAQVLYLAAHLTLQHHPRLIWYYDLHRLIEQEGARIDWAEVISRAEAFGWKPALRAALRGTRERLGTVLPSTVASLLAAGGRRRAPPAIEIPPNRIVLFWNKAHTLRPTARFWLIAGMLLPTPAYMRWRYGHGAGRLWPLAYAYRWLDVLGDGLLALGRAAWSRAQASAYRASPQD